MISAIHMKTFLVILLVVPAGSAAQIGPREFDDCDRLQSVMFTDNDMILVRCDTVFVLNKLTFKRFDGAYRDLRRKGTGASALIKAYDEIVTLQTGRIEQQARQYDELHARFASLSNEAETRHEDSSVRLSAALASMQRVTTDLTQTKSLLGEAKDIIEAEQRGFHLEKLLWGIGGIAAGMVVGILIAR